MSVPNFTKSCPRGLGAAIDSQLQFVKNINVSMVHNVWKNLHHCSAVIFIIGCALCLRRNPDNTTNNNRVPPTGGILIKPPITIGSLLTEEGTLKYWCYNSQLRLLLLCEATLSEGSQSS